ncbi:isochorismatase family protein [Rubrobacter tropicus]|uniref:Isochorismatase family protein n=1 Tax=Rubrobacter tropicus TaxID=2653851 RepID=A0A6G8QAX9_9ACTN|nr:cysteine hydrolase family protein [Rubrobacter tropicus]QIN83619.1 isochorismatase family protein [Rubrobacter tropicus]
MARNLALVVIDTQLGMFETPGVPPVPDGERLLQSIEGLIERARGADVTVVHVQHAGGPGHPLEKGTDGWRIHPRVAPLDGELVVEKETPDSFLNTTLREELESRGIGRLILAGMQTEYCVDTTCRRAFSLGYDVTLAADAHGTWDDAALSAGQIVAHHNEVMGNGFAEVVPSGEISFREPVEA